MPNTRFAYIAVLVLCFGATAQTRFNVKDYGAAGDGSTDDQGAIQKAAAAAANSGGGIVWFPAGAYAHSDLLDFGSNVTVQGEGAASVVKALNPQRSAIRFRNASGCGVSNIKIAGAPSPRKQNDESAGILLTNSNHCTITGVSIDGGASAAILLHGSTDVGISGNDIRNEMADGVHVVAGSQRVVVENNTAYNTGDDSFAAVAYANDPQTANITIRNNTSTKSHARGVTCIGAADCILVGNTIIEPASHGLAVAFERSYNTHHPLHAVVEHNVIRDVRTAGRNPVLVDGAEDVTLRGNEVSNSNSILIHGSAGVTLAETRIRDSHGAAILARDSSDVRLRKNEIARSSGAGILMEKVRGGEVSGNRLSETRSGEDAQRGDIDIAGSSGVAGEGNTTSSSRSIRVAESDQVTVKAARPR